MSTKLEKLNEKERKLEEQLLEVQEQKKKEKDDLCIKIGKKTFQLAKLKGKKTSLNSILNQIEIEISEQKELNQLIADEKKQEKDKNKNNQNSNN